MKALKGKKAVVTGGSYGIGRAFAIALAREGVDIILVARGQEGLQQTAERVQQAGSKAIICQADLATIEGVNKAAKTVENEFGTLDILWNGAFGWVEGPLEQVDDKDLTYFLDASVRGNILLVKKLLPLLLRSRDPHVINVVADWEFPATEGISAFIAAKRAIGGLGIALYKEKTHIRITNLYPADVASSEEFDVDQPSSEVIQKTDRQMIPLRDLIDLVIFILKLEGAVVHQVDIKPLDQDISVTFPCW